MHIYYQQPVIEEQPFQFSITSMKIRQRQAQDLRINMKQIKFTHKYSHKTQPPTHSNLQNHSINLPKLKNRLTAREYQPNYLQLNNSLDYSQYSSRLDSRLKRTKQICLLEEGRHIKNAMNRIISVPLSNESEINEKKYEYLQRLRKIQDQGYELEKSTSTIISKAKKVGKILRRKYIKLSDCTNSILSGVQDYCFEEQKNKIYKEQIREMWMRYDK